MDLCAIFGADDEALMVRSDRLVEALRRQILFALVGAGGFGMACRPEAAAGKPNPMPSAESKSPARVSPCSMNPESESCYPPFATPRSVGTGEPDKPSPRSAFDANGCLPMAEVSNSCCNPAVSGPRFDGKQCCYSFCTASCCGRPFLVEGRPRVAPVRLGVDWLSPDGASVHDDSMLDEPTARALADAWLADAQMEHASVAAFGRFMLQLLALGAPASFVRDAARAAQDEVTHAELCFALVSRLGGIAREPMPLNLDGAMAARTLAEVTYEVVLEGCVGETIAAFIAGRQLEGATDPQVRVALERIFVDEARHSELGWRFVRWALDVGGEEVHLSAQRAFSAALVSPPEHPVSPSARSLAQASMWRTFGRLAEGELRHAVHTAKTEIIAPCARALLRD